MVNPNSMNTSSNGGEQADNWKEVEAEAGKMDSFDIKVAQEAAAARRDFEEKKAHLGELRDKISNLAKPSGDFVDGGGLDAKEITYDTSRLEGKADTLRAEVSEARKQFEALSTEEGRQAEAERRRKEAEEYDKFFTQGLRAVGTGRLQEFDNQISEARDPGVKERLIAEREDYIRSVVLPAGKTVLEAMGNGTSEQNEGVEVSDDSREGRNAEKEVPIEMPSDVEKARDFAERVDGQALSRSIIREKVSLGKILKRVEKYDSDQGKPSMGERRQHKKDLQELMRYGYNPNGENSALFNSLARLSHDGMLGMGITEDIGRRRAEDWKMVELTTKGESGKVFRKELKRNGFSRLPEDWNDEDFTTDEMHRMAFIAKNLIKE